MLYRGEIITINSIPYTGQEMGAHSKTKTRRPMLIVSNNGYNSIKHLHLFLGMPITHATRYNQFGYYPITANMLKYQRVHGSVVIYQIQCLDYRARQAKAVDYIKNPDIINAICRRGESILKP